MKHFWNEVRSEQDLDNYLVSAVSVVSGNFIRLFEWFFVDFSKIFNDFRTKMFVETWSTSWQFRDIFVSFSPSDILPKLKREKKECRRRLWISGFWSFQNKCNSFSKHHVSQKKGLSNQIIEEVSEATCIFFLSGAKNSMGLIQILKYSVTSTMLGFHSKSETIKIRRCFFGDF